MVSPWALGSIALLLVNDHFLKDAFGNTLTGKLSDVAGVFLLPLLTLALVEIARFVMRSPRWQSTRSAIVAHCAATGVGFAAVKVVPVVGDTYEHVIGFLRKVATLSPDPAVPIVVVRDTTDLIVLPVLLGTYALASAYRADNGPPAKVRPVGQHSPGG